MAALTLPAELPEMRIVLRVTGVTVGRQLYFRRRLAVTVGAGELSVSARESEARRFPVIEIPDTPTVR